MQLDFTDAADTLTLDLTSAYHVKSLQQLQRTFRFDRQKAQLSVSDTVKYDAPQAFGTALITFSKWQQLDDHRLQIGEGDTAAVVTIDTGSIPVKITATVIHEDVRGGRQPTRIGIDLAQGVREATVQLTIQTSH